MFDNTMDETVARRVIRHLEACGGSDIITLDGAVYEIRARRLDETMLRQALEAIRKEGKP